MSFFNVCARFHNMFLIIFNKTYLLDIFETACQQKGHQPKYWFVIGYVEKQRIKLCIDQNIHEQ